MVSYEKNGISFLLFHQFRQKIMYEQQHEFTVKLRMVLFSGNGMTFWKYIWTPRFIRMFFDPYANRYVIEPFGCPNIEDSFGNILEPIFIPPDHEFLIMVFFLSSRFNYYLLLYFSGNDLYPHGRKIFRG